MARKTYTSTEVKSRWMKKNYKRYTINFRYDSDKALIDYVEKRKESEGITEIFREAIEALIGNENQ